MAKKLDPVIVSVLKDHGFGPEAAWDCHGTWVVYHRVLEQIAAKASITFDPPQVLEANGQAKSVALCVTGTLKDRSEWSVGEASPANNKNAYPYAMAEKRAKDRVILKLIGLHGLAYSEDEADDFKGANPAPSPVPTPTPTPAKTMTAADWVTKAGAEILDLKTAKEMSDWLMKNNAAIEKLHDTDKALYNAINQKISLRNDELQRKAA
jgi:hypothetical protein